MTRVAAIPVRDARYPTGVVMIAASGLSLSFVGLVIRMIDQADGWQILFYRSAGFAATVALVLLCRSGGRISARFRAIGASGWLLALSLAAGFTCYVFAMLHTTVANVVFVMSAGPIFAGLLGWAILGERVRAATWAAIAAALGGVALMVGDELSRGAGFGTVIALGMALSYAAMTVIIRRAPDIDMMPATFLAGVLTVLACLPMMNGFAVPIRDFWLLFAMGAGLVGFAFVMVTLAARHVPPAEVGLYALTEAILAPVWVWLWIAERPSAMTLVGGAIVLAAVTGQAVIGLRRSRPAVPY